MVLESLSKNKVSKQIYVFHWAKSNPVLVHIEADLDWLHVENLLTGSDSNWTAQLWKNWQIAVIKS